MVFQIQKFKIADLIFICTDKTNLKKEEIQEIKNRFENIVNFNNFIEQYEKSLFKNVNKNIITNFNCFEYEFEQKGE